MRWCRLFALAFLLAGPGLAVAAEPPALAKARALYNAGNYDAAIESATPVRGDRQFGDAAALVIARAHLELYRESAERAIAEAKLPESRDLSMAREALRSIQRAALSSRDQVDLLIGLGQTLFYSEQFGAGAELFVTALARASMLPPRDRDRLLDWWASALDREAQSRPTDGRGSIYERITARMEEELAGEPGSAVANYWLVAAARGAGDVERAWDSAVAAWVRAALVPETTKALRADLDRLVTEALIAERARTRPAREDPAVALRVEWERVKENWK
jgi:hypothetical protein